MGQPGRQLAPSSAAVTGRTVAAAGAGGALADGGAPKDGDGRATDGGEVAGGGGGAEVHCTSAALAVTNTASVAIRLKTSLGDEPLPLASIPKDRRD
jgi:hypothetical protein